MKKFILGFIAGGILAAAVTGFAVEYAVTENPYPVKVNGVETAIEGYNIDGSTYFKLRDVSAAVGGFEVGFADNTITIATEQQPEPTTAPAPTPITQNTELNPDGTRKYTIDGLPIGYFEDTVYVSARAISEKYNVLIIASTLYIKGNIILDNIPTSTYSPDDIDLTFYENTLYPLLMSLTE